MPERAMRVGIAVTVAGAVEPGKLVRRITVLRALALTLRLVKRSEGLTAH
jgi:hypothetical protein